MIVEMHMKKFLAGWILFSFVQTTAMTTVLRQTKRINPRNKQLCLNSPRDFGTHFIVGSKNQRISAIKTTPVKNISVNQQPFIVNGSSAHLIDESRQTQSFFTTVHNITSIIVHVIAQAQKSIMLAAFCLTDITIANALIEAHKKGVDVCIIVDSGKMKERSSKVQKLIKNNMCVYQYDCSLRPHYTKKDWCEPLMHHKCVVIDDTLVITGSANATKAAQNDNIENINILRDSLAVEEHHQEFERLKKYCIKCK